MKKAKRILTLLLAVVMVANVFAVSVFAEDAALTIAFSTPNATVEAGSTFDVIVNLKGSAANPTWGSGILPICYNSEYVSTSISGMAPLDVWADVVDTSNMTFGGSNYGGEPSAEEKANYGWDTYNVCGFTSKALATTDVSAGVDTLKITFTVAEGVADGTKIYVGVPATSVDMDGACELAFYNGTTGNAYEGNTDYDFSDFVYNYNIDAALVEVTVGAEAPVEYDLKWVQNQYRKSVNVEGAYDVGVKFGFDVSDINIQFEEGGTRSTNVARVGADIYVGEDKVDGKFESDYVYEVGTEYHYRVIIEGLAKDDATEYTVKPYLVYTDGTNETETVYGETVTVSAKTVIPQ